MGMAEAALEQRLQPTDWRQRDEREREIKSSDIAGESRQVVVRVCEAHDEERTYEHGSLSMGRSIRVGLDKCWFAAMKQRAR